MLLIPNKKERKNVNALAQLDFFDHRMTLFSRMKRGVIFDVKGNITEFINKE